MTDQFFTKKVNKTLAFYSDSYYCKYFSAKLVEISLWYIREYFLSVFDKKADIAKDLQLCVFKTMYFQNLSAFNYVIYTAKESEKSLR